jgi:hypothetical protein
MEEKMTLQKGTFGLPFRDWDSDTTSFLSTYNIKIKLLSLFALLLRYLLQSMGVKRHWLTNP